MTPEETMKSVLKSYIPIFVWLFLAAIALSPSSAHASGGEASEVEAQLLTARAWMQDGRWADVARMKLPPVGAPTWVSCPETEGELVFVRGLGAARAGYRAFAWYSVERLEGVRERAAAARNLAAADRIETLRNELRGELE
jgi:hypothetical protein